MYIINKQISFDYLKANMCAKILKDYFTATADAMLFRYNTHKTGNNAVQMSQAFHDIPQFKCFTI